MGINHQAKFPFQSVPLSLENIAFLLKRASARKGAGGVNGSDGRGEFVVRDGATGGVATTTASADIAA